MLISARLPANRLAMPVQADLVRWARTHVLFICFGLTLAISALDILTRRDVPATMFYAVPVLIVAWVDNNSRRAMQFGILNCILWAAATIFVTNKPIDGVMVFKGITRVALYASFGVILVRLKHLQENLRALAEERAQALAREAARALRLEREIMVAEEREKKRIGQDLHDGLCQHLVATAMAAGIVIGDVKEGQAQERDAQRVLELVQEAIVLTRNIAKGLYPIETRNDGLMQALEELALKTGKMFGVDCRFVCNLPVLVESSSVATNLYRIAQESISNALRHGRATKIEILLEETGNEISLRVRGNGRELPALLPGNDGMGLRIMADRAAAIGGQFSLRSGHKGGTEALCIAPIRAG